MRGGAASPAGMGFDFLQEGLLCGMRARSVITCRTKRKPLGYSGTQAQFRRCPVMYAGQAQAHYRLTAVSACVKRYSSLSCQRKVVAKLRDGWHSYAPVDRGLGRVDAAGFEAHVSALQPTLSRV